MLFFIKPSTLIQPFNVVFQTLTIYNLYKKFEPKFSKLYEKFVGCFVGFKQYSVKLSIGLSNIELMVS